MRIGKLPEPVLIRSVLKEISHRRAEVLAGPGVGRDSAAVEIGPGEVFVLSSDSVTGEGIYTVSRGVYAVVNDLAASGAEPVGIMATVLLPKKTDESYLKHRMRELERICRELHLEVLGGHTEVTEAVNQPVFSLTGTGKIKKQNLMSASEIKPGQDLVLTKWIGLEATAAIAREKKAELLERFSLAFVEEASNFEQYLSVLPEAQIAVEAGVTAMHDLRTGGVFGALWEMASGGDIGLEVDLRSIPVRQETVEICEAFGLNPYQVTSSGSLLLAAENGNHLVRALSQKGIHGAVIGKTTEGRERILRNQGEVRYLDKPQPDELHKIL
ncbi:AIR synthase family protein [Lactonifactor longoviformis]|uniref:AIR synthase family protein n=1 Tax=Lactonifactor longoviformis TaxID=341220 RepID=UPI0036F359E6